MTEFKVPELGENVTSADVSRLLVNVGDTIARDQPVVELETDKATVEVPSSVAGVVKEIKVKKGDKVTALVSPLRNGDPGSLLTRITLPDGRVLGNGGPTGVGPGTTAPASSQAPLTALVSILGLVGVAVARRRRRQD